MKRILSVLFATFFSAAFGQTITIPATTATFNPANNTIAIPQTVLTVTTTPAPVNTPLTVAAFKAMHIHIVSVEYKAGIHEVTGYNAAGILVTQRVLVGKGGALPDLYFTRPKFAIITIPFKMRGAVDTFPSKATAGLTNIGLSYNFLNYKLDRYLSTGTKSTHILSAGVFMAPNVDDVAPETTKNRVTKKSSQLFLSAGLSITYSYGDVSFVIVPVGFDFGTTSSSKKYIYNGKYWWGFGIGVSLKLFGLG